MENEASDARRRWPLLGMTDPGEVALPAAGAPSEDEHAVQPDANNTTVSSEPVTHMVRTERSQASRASEQVLAGATPLRKLFAAPTTTLAAESTQQASTDKPAQLAALFDRLRTGKASPRAAAKQEAAPCVRPWFLGGAGQR